VSDGAIVFDIETEDRVVLRDVAVTDASVADDVISP